MNRYTPATRVWMLAVALAAVAAAVVNLQTSVADPIDWPALALLAIGAAIAHAFPIRSALDGASYRLTNVFVVAGTVLLPPWVVAFLPVIAITPESLLRRQTPGVLFRWLFNVAQTSLAALVVGLWVHWAGARRAEQVSDLLVLLAAAALFTLLQSTLVGIAIALNQRLPLLRVETFSVPALLSDALIAVLGIALAGLWLVRPVLLLLAMPLLVIAHGMTRAAHLAHLAQVDPKTGLANSRHFERVLEDELAHSTRLGRPLALLFVDLDRFKLVNDTHGHAAGDLVLRQAGSLIASVLRTGDVVARFGGEEFVALLPGTDAVEAGYLAERVRSAVEATDFTLDDGTVVRCTVSVGIAACPEDGTDVSTLLRSADQAMYRAKQVRNAVARFQGGPPPLTGPPAPTPSLAPPGAEAPIPLATALLWANVVGGLLATVWSLIGVHQTAGWVTLLFFLALAVGADLLKVRVYDVDGQGISFSFTVAVTMAVVTVAPVAAPLVSLGAALVHLLVLTRPHPPDKALFNLTNPALAAGAASLVYLTVLPAETSYDAWHLLGALAAVLTFYAANVGSISLMVSLHSRRPLLAVLRESHWFAPVNLLLGLTGAFLGAAYPRIGVLGAAMFAAPLLVLRATLAFHASRSRRAIETLQAASSQLRALNDELAASEQRFRTLYETVASGVLVADRSGAIVDANHAAEQVLGLSLDQMHGRLAPTLWTALREDGSDLPDAEWPEALALRLRLPIRNVTMRVVRRDGEVRFLQVDSVPVLGDEGQPIWVVSTFIDVTARKLAEEALEHQALYDALTGLPNRTLLHDRLEQAILAAQRDNRAVALLVMDLDRFKEINDTLGHHCGDLLLQQVGQRLRAALRASDTVARLGGDEFAVILPTARNVRGATMAARKLLQALEDPFVVEGRGLDVRASVGIALCPDHGEDVATLLRRADVAMYVAKRSHTGYALYVLEQDQHTPGRLALVGELRQAIEQDQLVLYYQPKVDFDDGRVSCVEALVRWQHPQLGLLAPDQFIPLAEQTGLIEPLSRWVLGAALRQCRDWQEDRLDLSVAVNLSAQNLQDPTLPRTIAGLLRTLGLAPAKLHLEVTESAVIASPARAMDVLGRLRDLGVWIAIDDFGTGYSSLSYLKRLPADELKIDKSFVLHLATDDSDAAIVRSTIDLGHNLGLYVVAEGVEDEASRDLLVTLGCDGAQGFYFGRPMPAVDLVPYLRASPWRLRERGDARSPWRGPADDRRAVA